MLVMPRAFVLLSGGIDSGTCLYYAAGQFGIAKTTGVSVFYGQRHSRELDAAKTLCDRLGCSHHELNLSQVVPRTLLTDPHAKMPNMSYDEIKGVSPTYVPFRNGLLLSAVASWIQGQRERDQTGGEWGLFFGAHAEDARAYAYPDCTPEFIGAMANAIYMGTYHQLRLCTPLEWLGKAEIIKLGEKLGVPWKETWSCYAGGELHCGLCPTCRARRQGFINAGIADPTIYSNSKAA